MLYLESAAAAIGLPDRLAMQGALLLRRVAWE